MNIHYALQTYDGGNRDPLVPRYVTGDKSVITEKCVTSFLLSVEYAAQQHTQVNHIINIIDDHSSDKTIKFIKNAITIITSRNNNIKMIYTPLQSRGIMNSIRTCYEYLRDNGTDLVYQVQDDYLYNKEAVYEIIDIFFQIVTDMKSGSVVFPYNDPHIWSVTYKYKSTPRVVILGNKRYWIQNYDLPCCFLTSKEIFLSNWDLIEKFCNYPEDYEKMENESLSKMTTERGILSVTPIESVALHLQGELFKDPYIDWKVKWDNIPNLVDSM